MDDRTTQEEGELFDTTTPDDTTSADDTNESATAEQDGDQQRDVLDLPVKEDKSKTSVTEANKLKQLDAWATKINSKEKTLEDLPANLGWMKKDLEKLIDVKKEVAEVNLKDMVRREIQEEKAVVKFEILKEELNVVLNAEKKAQLSATYKKLLAKGLSPLDSLELAMESQQIDLQKIGTEARHTSMKIPSPGRKSKPTVEDMADRPWSEVVETIPKEKRLEYLRKLAYNNRG